MKGRKRDTGSRLPYFTLYPADWLSSATVSAMTAEEEGTFFRLLALAWVNDGLPEELERVRVLTKLSAARWKKFEKLFQDLFPTASDSRRRNVRQEIERNSANDKTIRRASAGIKGAEKRWQCHADAMPIAMANDGYTQIQIQIQSKDTEQQQAAVVRDAGQRQPENPTALQHADGEFTRFARLLTAAANKGIGEKFGQQPVPINASSLGAHKCTETLREAGVDGEFAASAIFECAKTLLLKQPPRSLGYFLQHVLDRWAASEARRDAAQVDPTTLSSSAAKPAEGDQLRYAAMRYAQEGAADWQAYCDERSIAWRAIA